MAQMVQVVVAADEAEAEEIRAILTEAGIRSELSTGTEEGGLAVLVPDASLELAQDAIEAMTEPDQLQGT